MKTSWHKVGRYEIYVEEGIVKHGVDRSIGVAVFPYRYNKKYDSWVIERGITLSALRAGLNRGTIILK